MELHIHSTFLSVVLPVVLLLHYYYLLDFFLVLLLCHDWPVDIIGLLNHWDLISFVVEEQLETRKVHLMKLWFLIIYGPLVSSRSGLNSTVHIMIAFTVSTGVITR